MSALLNFFLTGLRHDGLRLDGGVAADDELQRPDDQGQRALVLAFDRDDFESALKVYEEDASTLWAEREPGRRAVQLMLVHVTEELDTRPSEAPARLSFNPDGYVTLSD